LPLKSAEFSALFSTVQLTSGLFSQDKPFSALIRLDDFFSANFIGLSFYASNN
jgi:hypothetical protein